MRIPAISSRSVTDSLTPHRADTKQGYIVGPIYDWAFLIGSPLIGMALAFLLITMPINNSQSLFGEERPIVDFAIGAFVFAHLVIVIFRSHLNRQIFQLYPYRFTLVPIVLFACLLVSPWLLVACAVLAVFWDVYHSGMQTFGLARIYDMRAGNPPLAGRRLDWILNVLLYAGPIAAGATLMDHVDHFSKFEEVGDSFFTAIPALAETNAQYLSWAVIGIGIPFLIYYVYAYWRLSQQGYRVSPQKVALLVATAACSIYAWGFNPFGMAFFIMNFFHALQYFAIVWRSEKQNIAGFLDVSQSRWAMPAALSALLLLGFGFGVFAEANRFDAESWLFSLFLVISLMHFWYDGFVWSVRRKQV